MLTDLNISTQYHSECKILVNRKTYVIKAFNFSRVFLYLVPEFKQFILIKKKEIVSLQLYGFRFCLSPPFILVLSRFCGADFQFAM